MEELQFKLFDIREKIGDNDYNQLCICLKQIYEKKRREGFFGKWYRLYFLKQVKDYNFDDHILSLNMQYCSLVAYSKEDLDDDDIGKPFSTNIDNNEIFFMDMDEPSHSLCELHDGHHEIHYHEKILLKYEVIQI
tara:strand:+ start:1366 stop:1770 length:405 start_codon:yes stop_codon:yes gene_type:complete